MYVEVLHQPIIIFYWNFFSKELLNLCFATAIKRDPVKISHSSSLSLVPQKILWGNHKRFWGTKLNLFLVSYFCRILQLIIHYVFGTFSIKQLVVVLFLYEVFQRYTNYVIQGEIMQFQNFDAIQDKIRDRLKPN